MIQLATLRITQMILSTNFYDNPALFFQILIFFSTAVVVPHTLFAATSHSQDAVGTILTPVLHQTQTSNLRAVILR